jgi:hypothetical protein
VLHAIAPKHGVAAHRVRSSTRSTGIAERDDVTHAS